MSKIRTYSELSMFETFEERFDYLKIDGKVGRDTFGFDRYLNQKFYTSSEWRNVRNYVIVRDNGCDIGIEDRAIVDKILVHHMNPITPDILNDRLEEVLDPNYLICVSHKTHNALHYGDISQTIPTKLVVRTPGDTKIW